MAKKKTAAKAKKIVKKAKPVAKKTKAVAKKAVVKKVAVKKTVAKKPAVKKTAAKKKTVASKAATKKPAAKKTVIAVKKKKVVAKKPVAKKKVAVKKVAAKKAVAKKSVAKTIAKKVAAKKSAVKKAAPKKIAPKKAAPKKETVKKGEATLPIELESASDAEIDEAIESVVDEALDGEEAYGDEVTFADDDAELDEPADVAKKPRTSYVAPAPQEGDGVPEQLRDAVMKVLDERQAEDVVLVPLAGRSSLADYVIIASGRGARQVAAIADYLREAFFKLGIKQIRIEGQHEANWVLVDAGDVIVHLFRPEVRSYYDVDAIWAAKHPK